MSVGVRTCWSSSAGLARSWGLAPDSRNREVISWVATTTGISGEMIQDMMIHWVEQRFGDNRARPKLQWLTDKGSMFAAYRSLEIAAALNLEPRFAPVQSPRSTGTAETFVKTFKGDYVRVKPIPDAGIALLRDRSLDGVIQLRTLTFSGQLHVHDINDELDR